MPSAIVVESATISYSPAVMGRSWIFDLLCGRKSEPFVSLRGVTLAMKAGESIGVIGSNGAGKTTLLKVMAGLLDPISGSVLVNGKVTTILELGAGVEGALSGTENILLAAALQRFDRPQAAAFRDYVVSFSELGDALNRPVRTYSAGMLLRFVFSLRTFVRPEILIIDEVFGVGDQHFDQKARARTREILSEASAFALASHDLNLVSDLCSRTIWLEAGRVILDGPTFRVIDAYRASTDRRTELPDVLSPLMRACHVL